ncbi:hypothetical protein [Paraburkholderia sp. J67]|uniref:bestrophin-like domain n=1 Tax=Paraburkholderia sp. J67 TaxID=2805435 RepID=UPI002ABE9B56|nr:hypothetical protein [Paraburkholderia sp. J67]
MQSHLVISGAVVLIRFISIPSGLQFAGWAGLGLLMTAAGYGLARAVLRPREPHAQNGELGTIMAVVGVFFGLVIATMLARAVDHFDAAVKAVNREADAGAALYRVAAQGAPELARAVQAPLLQYLDHVVRIEWPRQSAGLDIAPESADLIDVSRAIGAFRPANPRELAWLEITERKLDDLFAARHARLVNTDLTIPIEIWVVDLLGELTLIVFGWLMHIPQRPLHLLLVMGIAMSVSLVLAATLVYDAPFHGDISVSDSPYVEAIHDIAHASASE